MVYDVIMTSNTLTTPHVKTSDDAKTVGYSGHWAVKLIDGTYFGRNINTREETIGCRTYEAALRHIHNAQREGR